MDSPLKPGIVLDSLVFVLKVSPLFPNIFSVLQFLEDDKQKYYVVLVQAQKSLVVINIQYYN